MKKSFLSFLIIFIFLFSSVASAEDDFSFRNGVMFGMSREQVITCEGREPDESSEEDGLYYAKQKSAGKDVSLLYQFDSDKLYRIYVRFIAEHSNDNLFLQDFDEVDVALQAKYGEAATLKEFSWKSDTFKGDETHYGLAVSAGYLVIGSIWYSGNCQIGHILMGDNYKINHAILYRPTNNMSKKPDTTGI